VSDLEILRDRVAEKKGKTGGPSAANMRVKHLRGLFRWAVKHRNKTHVEHDIAAHLERVGENSSGHLTWTSEQLGAFEKRHPIGTVARMAFDIFQYTGARISDVILLGPKHVRDDVDKRGKPIKVLRFHTTKKKAGEERGPEVTVGMCKALLDSIAACNQKGLRFG
jgi:integrase